MINWPNVIFAETTFVTVVVFALGKFKLPWRWFRKRRLVTGFPWGYYPDKIPTDNYILIDQQGSNFLHNVGTEFGCGLVGFGEFGEFTGFGELGEFGDSFFGEGPVTD